MIYFAVICIFLNYMAVLTVVLELINCIAKELKASISFSVSSPLKKWRFPCNLLGFLYPRYISCVTYCELVVLMPSSEIFQRKEAIIVTFGGPSIWTDRSFLILIQRGVYGFVCRALDLHQRTLC
jgi:hypothetical protein